MSTLRTELGLLRWPILRLALALVIALLICLVSLHFTRKSGSQAEAAEQSATRARQEALRLQGEEQDMRAKIAEYQAIEARGIIGPERRLDWVELMRSIQRERRLLGLEYEIQPSQPMPGNPGSGSGYIFMDSLVRIQLPLLHEEDLLHFLDDVRGNAAALTRLRSCKLQRNNSTSSTSHGQDLSPQLIAECQMEWITLIPEGTKK